MTTTPISSIWALGDYAKVAAEVAADLGAATANGPPYELEYLIAVGRRAG